MGLYDIKRNLSEFNECPLIYHFENITVLAEQSKLFILNKTVRIYETPGHDVSCLSFVIDHYFFTGDSYIPGMKTFTKWSLSEKQKALLSEKRILEIVNVE